MTVVRSVVMGSGSALPAGVVTNEDLAKRVDTSDEWIVQRTGIRERRIAGPGEFTSTLGLSAARQAIASAGLVPADIDLVLLGTIPTVALAFASAVVLDALVEIVSIRKEATR